MALEKIDGGWYDPKSHGYYGHDGKWIPSATQLLGLVGFSDYSMVKPEVLERKRLIGSEVHGHCAGIDKYGDVDPSWISDDAKPYVEAYQLFRHQRNFEPDPEWIEKPIIANVHGYKFGVTPDACGRLDGFDAILERKCVQAAKPVWAVQTALQEFGRYGTRSLGRSQRFALQLLENGKYKIDPHTDNALDEHRAISALVVVYARLDAGQKLWEQV